MKKNMKRCFMAICLLAVFIIAGCASGKGSEVSSLGLFKSEFVVGEDIRIDDITDFYYTYSDINYDASYQRYRFYAEDGKHMFFHETRERKGDYGPATEDDTTLIGTIELSDDEWSAFFDIICKGRVIKREESADSGDSGPWFYLYWKNDKSKYQEFSFASYSARTAFEEFCQKLAGAGEAEEVTENDTEAAAGQPETEEVEGMPATLLYQGHGSVRITTGDGKVIYIDPFMGAGYDLPADLILMTHGHYDHVQDKLITKRNEGCRKITWVEALAGGSHQSFDLGYVIVEAVEAGYNKNHNASECVGYVLSFPDGVKAYFSGDTSTTPTMPSLAEKKLYYAFICCDGVYNMGVDEASECARVINAKHTIPYHMIPAEDKGFDMGVAESFKAEGRIILQPGEELAL